MPHTTRSCISSPGVAKSRLDNRRDQSLCHFCFDLICWAAKNGSKSSLLLCKPIDFQFGSGCQINLTNNIIVVSQNSRQRNDKYNTSSSSGAAQVVSFKLRKLPITHAENNRLLAARAGEKKMKFQRYKLKIMTTVVPPQVCLSCSPAVATVNWPLVV